MGSLEVEDEAANSLTGTDARRSAAWVQRSKDAALGCSSADRGCSYSAPESRTGDCTGQRTAAAEWARASTGDEQLANSSRIRFAMS